MKKIKSSTRRETRRIRFFTFTRAGSKSRSFPSLESRGPDEFCGEAALTGKPLRLATVTAMSPCEIVRLDKATILGLLHREQDFADYFLSHLLTRTARVEADLVDQLFNSSEMRLARALLLLANYGGNLGREPVQIKVNQETLAALIG